ncbi:hypothetical protein LEMLEM_LOCUS23381 [Lemmus lemmus]
MGVTEQIAGKEVVTQLPLPRCRRHATRWK